MNLRSYREGDLESVVRLFTESVHCLTKGQYSKVQRTAWAPPAPDWERWKSCLASMHTVVAESEGMLAGFISFEPDGHIELLYTGPSFARRGVASGLYRHMDQYLRALGVEARFTEASLVARPFFERQGLRVVEAQRVERSGVVLSRFAMSK